MIHAVSKLRLSLRLVVVLRGIHGLTNAETARRLGLTVAAVKARDFPNGRDVPDAVPDVGSGP